MKAEEPREAAGSFEAEAVAGSRIAEKISLWLLTLRKLYRPLYRLLLNRQLKGSSMGWRQALGLCCNR